LSWAVSQQRFLLIFQPFQLIFQPFLHACSPRSARRAGLTVYPPLGDVAAASSQSCARKSKFGLRHAIKLN
jgi:hypothetical protein